MTETCSIASPHHLATEAGERAYRSGGNAIDAALTSAAVLTVVYPHMCSVGGDLWALVADPDGKVTVVDGCGAAPAAVSAEELRDKHGQMPITGPDTITVPGVTRGWSDISEIGGRLRRDAILEEAIRYAGDGATVAPSLARAIEEEASLIVKDEGLRNLLTARGALKVAGDPLVQPELAGTLEAIASAGDESLYGGSVGRDLVRGLNQKGSPIGIEDLAAHGGGSLEPLSTRFGGLEVLTSPPPTQGFALLEILQVVELLSAEGPVGADVLARIFRLSSIDRDRFLADPKFFDVPLLELLSAGHIADLAGQANGVASDDHVRTGHRPRPTGDTVAVVAVDSEGWAVSIIQSVFHSFGSGILEPRTGILCHNRGAGFTLDPDSPNVIAPGKRPMHTLVPVIARNEDGLLAATGTMGGLGHPQILAQLLIGLRDGESAKAIVDRPRFTVGGLDVGSEKDVVHAESTLDSDRLAALNELPMDVLLVAGIDESLGHSQIALIDGDDPDAASDPRADGSAAIVNRDGVER